MKIRLGFVSNSSNSSFVIDRYFLTEEQTMAIIEHIEYAKQILGWEINENCIPWNITLSHGVLFGDVSIDNFDMKKFMEEINVNMTKVRFEKH